MAQPAKGKENGPDLSIGAVLEISRKDYSRLSASSKSATAAPPFTTTSELTFL